MKPELLIGLFALCATLYVALTLWLRRHQRMLGIGHGRLLAADDSRLGSPILRSRRLGLVGRPDHLIQVEGARIPVEQKPTSRRLYETHVIQLGVLCAILEDLDGIRPPYGLVVLAGGRQERVPYTPELEARVHKTVAELRAILSTGCTPGPRYMPRKCPPCGYNAICWGGDPE